MPSQSTRATQTKRIIQKPQRLYRGRKVALIAPAFSFDRTLFEQGAAALKSRFGLKSIYQESIFDQSNYFAGTDQRRASEFVHWLLDPTVHALFAVRGGYGCARIYSTILNAIRQHLKNVPAAKRKLAPKIIAGYSDLTLLLNGLFQDLGWITFHAPVTTGRAIHSPLPIEEQSFQQSLFSLEPLGAITSPEMQVLSKGIARGRIVGGCLSLLTASLGTPYEIQTKGRVLFLEDVDERPYRIDRMLTQLLHAGKLHETRGIVFGQFANCEPSTRSAQTDATSVDKAILSALAPLLEHYKIPILSHFPAGHGTPQLSFPIGVHVELRAEPSRPELIFEESGVE